MQNFSTDILDICDTCKDIKIIQDKEGYRFSIDAILLADFVLESLNNSDKTIVELGTGCGIVPIIIALKNKILQNSQNINIYGIEIQKDLFDLSLVNIKENNLENTISLICSDMQNISSNNFKSPIDIVIANPPYRKVLSGKLNLNNQKAIARHELKINLKSLIQTVKRILKNKGKFVVIYVANRLIELLEVLKLNNLEPKKLRLIYPDLNSEAKLVLIEAVLNGNIGLKVSPPMILNN